ncbi:CLIP domain-containing serine protease HP8 isoform X2 [Anabrus simplex]|uniref:CLIP domain-containing serine protease HP8 isoform X2 n=1 Tax=Anabrus simplex TaxID=316456 RepID=UPI0035A35312
MISIVYIALLMCYISSEHSIDDTQREPFCGGTLINKRFVITAKHCEPKESPIKKVRLGEHNWHSNPDQQRVHNGVFIADKFQEVEVENSASIDDEKEEILLLMLKRNVEPTAFIKPLCLPNPEMMNEDLINKRVIAIGWGYYNGQGRTSDAKQWVSLTIKSADENKITTVYSEGRDTCTFDSGGPIMKIDPKSAHYVLVGVVWQGPQFCGHESKDDAVYANVVTKQTWIKNKMKELFNASHLKNVNS